MSFRESDDAYLADRSRRRSILREILAVEEAELGVALTAARAQTPAERQQRRAAQAAHAARIAKPVIAPAQHFSDFLRAPRTLRGTHARRAQDVLFAPNGDGTFWVYGSAKVTQATLGTLLQQPLGAPQPPPPPTVATASPSRSPLRRAHSPGSAAAATGNRTGTPAAPSAAIPTFEAILASPLGVQIRKQIDRLLAVAATRERSGLLFDLLSTSKVIATGVPHAVGAFIYDYIASVAGPQTMFHQQQQQQSRGFSSSLGDRGGGGGGSNGELRRPTSADADATATAAIMTSMRRESTAAAAGGGAAASAPDKTVVLQSSASIRASSNNGDDDVDASPLDVPSEQHPPRGVTSTMVRASKSLKFVFVGLTDNVNCCAARDVFCRDDTLNGKYVGETKRPFGALDNVHMHAVFPGHRMHPFFHADHQQQHQQQSPRGGGSTAAVSPLGRAQTPAAAAAAGRAVAAAKQQQQQKQQLGDRDGVFLTQVVR